MVIIYRNGKKAVYKMDVFTYPLSMCRDAINRVRYGERQECHPYNPSIKGQKSILGDVGAQHVAPLRQIIAMKRFTLP